MLSTKTPHLHFSVFQNTKTLSSLLRCLSLTPLALIVACGGGGSGDNSNAEVITENPSSTAIAPLSGTWNLPSNWKGENNDVAYLVIRQPSTDGSADAIVYDYDDANTGLGQNCYYIDGGEGRVYEAQNQKLFLDIVTFPDAIVALNANGTLSIEYTVGPNTGLNRQTNTLTAARIGLAETDITPLCEF